MALHLEVLELRDRLYEAKMKDARNAETITKLHDLLDQKTAYAESLERERDRLKVAIEHSLRGAT